MTSERDGFLAAAAVWAAGRGRRNRDGAEREVLALGARRLPAEVETGFRVFADPVGHPLRLVFGRGGAGAA